MSKMKELYEKVSADKSLQEEFGSILQDAEKTGEADTKEKLIKFAKAQGYDISIEEMQAFFSKITEKNSTELSAAELDMVAGGKGLAIFISIVGLGVICGIASLATEIEYKQKPETHMDCKTTFEDCL